MKYARVLFTFAALLSAALPCAAQQPFDWPFQPGDRVVIGGTLMRFDEPHEYLHFYFDSAFATKCTMQMYPRESILFEPSSSISYTYNNVGLTVSGMVASESHGYLEDLFPNSPPLEDTVWLNKTKWMNSVLVSTPYRYCTNTRVFDTTVFGESVTAFAADIYSLDNALIYRYTLAEKYWVIHVETPDGHVQTLNRFKLGDQTKDIGPYTFHFPSLCPTLRYVYDGTYFSDLYPTPTGDEYGIYQRAVRDTMIHDTTYYLGKVELFRNASIWGPTRQHGDTLFFRNGMVETAISAPTLFLGDSPYSVLPNEEWLVAVDTAHFQSDRLAFTFISEVPGGVDVPIEKFVYYSGLGLFSKESDDGVRKTSSVLKEFTPCVVGIESPLPSLPFWQSVVYPSPARDGITIAIQHAATAAPLAGTLLITDALGRTALTLPWEDISERSALAIPIAGFAPGVYYYRLLGSEAWLAGQFVVER